MIDALAWIIDWLSDNALPVLRWATRVIVWLTRLHRAAKKLSKSFGRGRKKA